MPPKINRELPKGKEPAKTGLRGRIQKVADIRKGLKVALYGFPKTGKTRLACTFPGRKLIIGTEDGTASVKDDPDTEFIMIDSSEEFTECLKIAVEDEYDNIILDQAGGFQMILLKEQLRVKEVPLQLSWGLAKQQDWQAVAGNFKEHVNRMLSIADKGTVNCIVIAHERNLVGEKEMEQGVSPLMGPGITPAAASWLNGAADYLCRLFIREAMETKEIVTNGKSSFKSKGTGKIEYVMRINGQPGYTIGFRVPIGKELEVDEIVNPTYDKIMEIINGE